MKIIFLFLFSLIIIVNSYRSRDFKTSCNSIQYPSKKNCGVFSTNDNERCCYITWSNSDKISDTTNSNEECIYLPNEIKEIKETVNSKKEEGYQNVKILCSDHFLQYYLILFLLLIIF